MLRADYYCRSEGLPEWDISSLGVMGGGWVGLENSTAAVAAVAHPGERRFGDKNCPCKATATHRTILLRKREFFGE